MRQPNDEYPPEFLSDPILLLPKRMMARDDLDWEAPREAYGNAMFVRFGLADDAKPRAQG